MAHQRWPWSRLCWRRVQPSASAWMKRKPIDSSARLTGSSFSAWTCRHRWCQMCRTREIFPAYLTSTLRGRRPWTHQYRLARFYLQPMLLTYSLASPSMAKTVGRVLCSIASWLHRWQGARRSLQASQMPVESVARVAIVSPAMAPRAQPASVQAAAASSAPRRRGGAASWNWISMYVRSTHSDPSCVRACARVRHVILTPAGLDRCCRDAPRAQRRTTDCSSCRQPSSHRRRAPRARRHPSSSWASNGYRSTTH